MNQEQIWQEFNTLPPVARQQVIDFIAFLRAKNNLTQSVKETKLSLKDEPFVGMWQDNEAMSDATSV